MIGCCKIDGLCIHTKHKDGNSWKGDASILYAGSIHRAAANLHGMQDPATHYYLSEKNQVSVAFD